MLIKRGTLRKGVHLVAGTAWGRVRTMRNDFTEKVERVLPAEAAEVSGWDSLPSAGDLLLEVLVLFTYFA